MDSLAREIEHVKSIVGKYFPVYETKVQGDVLSLFITPDPQTLGDSFDALRRELMPEGYIPMVVKEGGEHAILVQRKPPMRFRSPRINLVLLAITAFTTVLAGGSLWAGYQGLVPDPADPLGDFRLALAPWNAGMGALVFAMPLLVILGTHEMAHYLTARHYGVAASLPFFLPSLPPLGTFGALISMREPIPNKRALMDIGISGPLAGLALAIPVSALGLFLTSISPGAPINNAGGNVAIGLPALWVWLLLPMLPGGAETLHPLAFAGWVGIFVTALNLLPAGQLDGGHVARAALGRRARYLSYATLAAMIGMGYFYIGWAILAGFIFLLGPRHPPPLDDLTKLSIDRKALGGVAVVVMALCFVLVPLEAIAPVTGLEFRVNDGPVHQWDLNLTTTLVGNVSFTVNNTGNVEERITLGLGPNATALVGQGWEVNFTSIGGTAVNTQSLNFTLNSSETRLITVFVRAMNSTPGPPPYTVDLVAKARAPDALDATDRLVVVVRPPGP